MHLIPCFHLWFALLLGAALTVLAPDVIGAQGESQATSQQSIPAAGTIPIAVIDMDALNQATAFQEFQKAFTHQVRADQQFIAGQENAFREQDQKFQQALRDLNNLDHHSPEAQKESDSLIEQQQAYGREVAQFQDLIQHRKEYLDGVFRESKMRMYEQVSKIVHRIAQERNLLLVIHKSQVFYTNNALDITELVIKELSAQIPNIKTEILNIESFKDMIYKKMQHNDDLQKNVH